MNDRQIPTVSQAEDVLKNYCLNLAQAWGDDWLQPITNRLNIARPDLSDAEVSQLNDIACKTMNEAYGLVYDLVEQGKFEITDDTKQNFGVALMQKFPWIDDDNRDRLFSTGCYYAMK